MKITDLKVFKRTVPAGSQDLLSGFHLPVLMIICAILFFWNIHVIPITDGDSAFYGKIAKNIVESGNWLTMHYGDASTIIDKPPLMMWVTAASFKLFGVNEFALNFWHSLCALLVVLFTYKLAKEIYNERVAFISSIILATTAQFFYQARSPLQDIPLTLFILLSLYSFILFEKRSNAGYLYLSSIFVSLAVLTKGPVGLVLPALILLIYVFFNKIKVPWTSHFIFASGLFLLIALPWFLAEYRILGRPFLDIFIGHNLGRYFKPIDTIGSEAVKYAKIKPQYDFYSYFLQLFINAIPWAGFIYPAIYYNIKKKAHSLPLICFAVVLLFFSFSLNYKISRYILPAFPALAIIIGKMISDLLEGDGDKEAMRMSMLSAALTLVLVMIPLFTIAFTFYYVSFKEVSGYYSNLLIGFLVPMSLALIERFFPHFCKKIQDCNALYRSFCGRILSCFHI